LAQKQASKSIQDLVRDTFTPTRVGLLSWAFAAVIMSTVGLASYQFSYQHANFLNAGQLAGGLMLPPAGDVDTTASVSGMAGPGIAVDVMHLPDTASPSPVTDIRQGQLEVLQEEIIRLRRRMSALSEQNMSYSSRIAALEKQIAHDKLAGSSKRADASDKTAAPGPGVVITEAAPSEPTTEQTAPRPAAAALRSAEEGHERAPSDAPERTSEHNPSSDTLDPEKNSTPRLISLYRTEADIAAPAPETMASEEPVRIVAVTPATPPQARLPETSDPPMTTGSIPKPGEETLPDSFDATPTQTTLRPKVITPSGPSGRLRGGDRQLKRSDFGAIIGHYRSMAGAAKAWADFKTQNAERMRDLRPLLMQRQTPDGGIALMVGPFANAADAAVACLHLLDVTDLCHPALFAGDPLVTAAEFRDSAF